jgi:hypothetical protein
MRLWGALPVRQLGLVYEGIGYRLGRISPLPRAYLKQQTKSNNAPVALKQYHHVFSNSRKDHHH